MAYTIRRIQSRKEEKRSSKLQSEHTAHLIKPDNVEFYELEAGIVLEVIQDETHRFFKNIDPKVQITTSEWNRNFQGQKLDYSWIGRVKFRLVHSNKNTKEDDLSWAIPLDSNISEYPLVHETVIISKYGKNFFYSRKLNTRNWVNHNVEFRSEIIFGSKNQYDSLLANTSIFVELTRDSLHFD